jgi:outer membrane receptor protein involved in Fe transport
MANNSVLTRGRAAFLIGAATFLVTGAARAADANSGDASGVETVVVTGTHIPRPEYELPNPTTTLKAEEILHSGTINLTDYLKRVPALTASLGDVATTGLNTPATDAGSSLGGLNLLNLRNLGFDRTLVLEDGQRIIGSSTGDSGVDVETIPITLIANVDVVTGGSSAVYGADGVTGVVNFVLKHDLEGIDARVQVGGAEDGGASKYIAAVSVGHNFDNSNGNIELTYETSVQDHLNFLQRSFTRPGGAIFFVPNPANSGGTDPTQPANIPTKNAFIIGFSGIGAIDSNLDGNPDFLGNGTPYDIGSPINGEFTLGGNGLPAAAAFGADLIPNQHRQIVQLTGDEEFSRWFKLTGEFRYAHVDTSSASEPSFFEFQAITDQNPFLPANVAAAITANGTSGLGPDGSALGLLNEFPYLIPGTALVENVMRNTYRSVIGASGDFPLPDFFHDSKYNLHLVYGQTDIQDNIEHDLESDRFAAALDAVIDPATGKPTCRSNLEPGTTPANLGPLGLGNTFDLLLGFPTSGYPTSFTPGPSSGCSPINLFDPTANNKAALAFAFPTLHNTGILTEWDVNGLVSFDFPQVQDIGFAKPLSAVLGGEWRRESSSSMSPALSTTPGLFFNAGASPVKGNFDVAEAFGELSIPVLADQPYAQELSFDLAGRVSSYSTAGTDETWKLGFVYSPIADIKFRGTDAVAVRAPDIGELFAPQQQVFQQINDPCDPAFIGQGTPFRTANCQALMDGLLGPGNYTAGVTPVQSNVTTPVLIGGNPKLSPETARTYTVGVVLQPGFIPGFVATIDYYRVSITNAIEAPTAQAVADQCVDLSTINNPFCAQITRRTTAAGVGSPAGSISQGTSTQINVALFYTAGVDFTAAYHADLDDYLGPDSGQLDLHLIGNHLDKIATTPLPGQAPKDTSNQPGSPFWQFNLDAAWSLDKWSVDYNWQWYNGILNFTRQTVISEPNVIAKNLIHTADQNIHSIQVGYDVSSELHLYGGIDNIFYQKPSPNNADIGYPVSPIGRFFYAGVKFNTDDFSDFGGLGL